MAGQTDEERRSFAAGSGCDGGSLAAERHSRQANFGFCDGHVKAMRSDNTKTPLDFWRDIPSPAVYPLP